MCSSKEVLLVITTVLFSTAWTFPHDLNHTTGESGEGHQEGDLTPLEIARKIHYHWTKNTSEVDTGEDDSANDISDVFLGIRPRSRLRWSNKMMRRYGVNPAFVDKLERFRDGWWRAVATGRSRAINRWGKRESALPTAAHLDYFKGIKKRARKERNARRKQRRRGGNRSSNGGNRNDNNRGSGNDNSGSRGNNRGGNQGGGNQGNRGNTRRRGRWQWNRRTRRWEWVWVSRKKRDLRSQEEHQQAKSRTKRQAGILIRKEIRAMTNAELDSFFDALRSMAETEVDGISEYELFVQFHQRESSPAAHFGAAFPPWHREFLYLFEVALWQHGCEVGIPYWDTTIDARTGDIQGVRARDSVVWSDNLMGNVNGRVTSGRVADWNVLQRCQNLGGRVTRGTTTDEAENIGLYQDSDVDEFLGYRRFEQLATNQDEQNQPAQFEVRHGGPHVWVGGHMGDVICSPSDPIFWLHHSFVDLLFQRFRGVQTSDPWEYPTTNIGGAEHDRFAEMRPFVITFGTLSYPMVNQDGLNTFYSRAYRYELIPRRCSRDRQCGGGINLLCFNGRCCSKIRRGGSCGSLPRNTGCETGSFCINGRCQ